MTWQVRSETGTLRDVLLCRPDHYRWIPTNAVAQQTLLNTAPLDRSVMRAQFAGLVALLEACGVMCHYLSPDPAAPYQVYTRDSSATLPRGVLLTQLRMDERRGEIGAVLDFHAGHDGFWKHASAGSLEGGDIHILRHDLAVVGWSGMRTTRPGAEQLAAWLEQDGCTVRLQPFAEHFLHLDVLFCMATENLAVACVEVFGDDFAAWLAEHDIAVIPATYREAMVMSCNILSVGQNRVVSPAHSTRINAALRSAGVAVYDPPLDCFARGGGSVHCMTMPLRRDS